MAEGVKWEFELYFFSLGNGIWLAWSANHIPEMGLGFGKKIWGQEKGFITPPSLCGGLMVSVHDSRSHGSGSSPGWGHCVLFLVRHFTCCTNGYRQI